MAKIKILRDMLTVCSEYLTDKLRFRDFLVLCIRVAGRSIKQCMTLFSYALGPTTIVPYHFGSVQTLYTPNFIPVTLSLYILHLR